MAGVSPLVNPRPDEIIYEGHYWRVLVNLNQNLLGRCVVALKRHEEDLFKLTTHEKEELWSLAAKVRQSLGDLFQADHFNFSFLGNSDRHLHLHIVPRYRGTRFFAGLVFDDKAWGHHYDLIPRRVPPEVALQLVAALKEKLMPLVAARSERHKRTTEKRHQEKIKRPRGRPPKHPKPLKAKAKPASKKTAKRKRR